MDHLDSLGKSSKPAGLMSSDVTASEEKKALVHVFGGSLSRFSRWFTFCVHPVFHSGCTRWFTLLAVHFLGSLGYFCGGVAVVGANKHLSGFTELELSGQNMGASRAPNTQSHIAS